MDRNFSISTKDYNIESSMVFERMVAYKKEATLLPQPVHLVFHPSFLVEQRQKIPRCQYRQPLANPYQIENLLRQFWSQPLKGLSQWQQHSSEHALHALHWFQQLSRSASVHIHSVYLSHILDEPRELFLSECDPNKFKNDAPLQSDWHRLWVFVDMNNVMENRAASSWRWSLDVAEWNHQFFIREARLDLDDPLNEEHLTRDRMLHLKDPYARYRLYPDRLVNSKPCDLLDTWISSSQQRRWIRHSLTRGLDRCIQRYDREYRDHACAPLALQYIQEIKTLKELYRSVNEWLWQRRHCSDEATSVWALREWINRRMTRLVRTYAELEALSEADPVLDHVRQEIQSEIV